MGMVRLLREAGFDVRAVAEDAPGIADEAVALLANADERILLTEDRDFGRLFYAESHVTYGVIYMRYSARAKREFFEGVLQFVRSQGDGLLGSFAVLQPGRNRIGRIPPL